MIGKGFYHHSKDMRSRGVFEGVDVEGRLTLNRYGIDQIIARMRNCLKKKEEILFVLWFARCS
jgi:hypothetical protein